MRWLLLKIVAGLGVLLAGALALLSNSRRQNKTLKDHIEVEEKVDEVVDRVRKAVDDPPDGGYGVDRVLAEIRAREQSGHSGNDN